MNLLNWAGKLFLNGGAAIKIGTFIFENIVEHEDKFRDGKITAAERNELVADAAYHIMGDKVDKRICQNMIDAIVAFLNAAGILKEAN